jgi:hypothetical protein
MFDLSLEMLRAVEDAAVASARTMAALGRGIATTPRGIM